MYVDNSQISEEITDLITDYFNVIELIQEKSRETDHGFERRKEGASMKIDRRVKKLGFVNIGRES